MSSPYDNRGSSRRRNGLWSHWVPLAVTVTVATVGVAAWIWSQRNNDEEEDGIVHDLDYENGDYGDNAAYGVSGDGENVRDLRSGEVEYGISQGPGLAPDATGSGAWGARMSGALRRTPSPQQFFDRAGKTVAAGVAAAGTAVGSALAAIREEDKTAFADHETWSQEADSKKATPTISQSREFGKKRKTVSIIVSADTQLDNLDDDDSPEHASILSHIPQNIDFSKVKLFILIYAPSLKDAAADAPSNLASTSLSSSFSMIGHEQSQTPGDESKNPLLTSSTNPAFNAIYSQALGLVEKEAMVLPFTSPSGHVHILHHLKPEIVYLQESLAGESGSNVQKLQTWLRYNIILVVGAESGHGGLADSESEAEKPSRDQKWWQRDDRVGRGRGVVVVDSMRVHDDWSRRVQEIE